MRSTAPEPLSRRGGAAAAFASHSSASSRYSGAGVGTEAGSPVDHLSHALFFPSTARTVRRCPQFFPSAVSEPEARGPCLQPFDGRAHAAGHAPALECVPCVGRPEAGQHRIRRRVRIEPVAEFRDGLLDFLVERSSASCRARYTNADRRLARISPLSRSQASWRRIACHSASIPVPATACVADQGRRPTLIVRASPSSSESRAAAAAPSGDRSC